MECHKIRIDYGIERESPSVYGKMHKPGDVINELPRVGSKGYLRVKKYYTNRTRQDKYIPAVKLPNGGETLVIVENYTKSEVDPYEKGNRITVKYTTKNGYVGKKTYDTKLIGCGNMIFINEKDGEKIHDKRGSVQLPEK